MNLIKCPHYLLFFMLLLFQCTGNEEAEIFKLSKTYPQELQQLHENVITYIIQDHQSDEQVSDLFSQLSEQGTWPGIDYQSKTRGAWSPRTHLANLLQLAVAYQTPGTEFYQDKAASEKIHLALNYWLDNDFTSPNWWHPEIGTPMLLGPTVLLMEKELSEDQLQNAIHIMNRSRMGMTGQNKVWLSGNVLLKSLLLRHADSIRMASASIQEELVVSEAEGVQPDWSYHQHGPQLQFGNYGLSYAADMIKWVTILRETPFQFDEHKVEILRNYLLEGQRWVVWKGQMDISACGRQLFIDSPESKAESLYGSFTKMETLDAENAELFRRANDYTTLSGNRHFWRSDFQIQRSQEYYFSVKMCSKRVIGAESCNSENIQGYYMGDGAAFLYQTGEEYRNIFPFLDWKKIPGTTTQQFDEPLPILNCRGYRIDSDFVGGVSDGENGIAVLDYNRDGVKARKSWFMFNDQVVCLGNRISLDIERQVTTGINQVFLNGSVIISTGTEEISASDQQVLADPSWILHDGLGYLFPVGGKVHLQTNAVEGSWNWVAKRYPEEILSREVFKLYLDHGVNPNAASYAYMLIPNADKGKLNRQVEDPLFDIMNGEGRQEVVARDGTIAGIIFYNASKSEALGGIAVNNPCVVMLKKQANGLQLSVADPTQKLSDIEMIVNGKYGHDLAKVENDKTHIRINLPSDQEAGRTVRISLTTK